MPGSAIWRRKLLSYATRLDVDKDGLLTAKDFDAMADRYIQLQGESQAAKKFRWRLSALWNKYFDEPSKEVKLTPEAYVDLMAKAGPEQVLTDTHAMLLMFFNLIDTNENGYIELEEFRIFYKIVGLDVAMADESFKMIDTNRDGKLSREEFLACGVEFYTGDDEKSESKYFYGPLL